MARNVDVGTLIDSPQVPQQLRSCTILYSPEYNKFAIVNKNGQTEQIVSFDEYHQFVKMGIINFNSNAQSYVESFYNNMQPGAAPATAPPYGSAQADGYMQQAASDSYQDFAQIEDENTTPKKEKPIKDPTKRLFMFFLITFILAMVIAVGRVALLPILQATSNVIG